MDVGSIQNSLNPASTGSKAERAPASSASVRRPGEREIVEQVGGELSAARAAAQKDEVGSITREQVEAAVATIQDFVQSVRRSINFSLEEGSGRVVVKVTDAGSGDVIRQIPSEEALQLAENLSEVRSLLFKAEA